MLDPREMIHEARLKKRPEELDAMRRAIAISAEAHKAAMRKARGGMREWQIEATVDYTFRSRGAAGPSYPSIIASGPNAATLHYINNDREMRSGELLLIDAGCEYDFYASDVTRTFPIGTRFTPLAARRSTEIVLDAQRKADRSDQAGRAHSTTRTTRRCACWSKGCVDLGLVKGPLDEAIANGAYRRYYMHRTSHWLGMDVHDVGLYRVDGESRALEPGMVLTVEPGIYIAPDDDECARASARDRDSDRRRRAGHRGGHGAAIPKTIDEVEALTSPCASVPLPLQSGNS